jgi:hypothetical protein
MPQPLGTKSYRSMYSSMPRTPAIRCCRAIRRSKRSANRSGAHLGRGQGGTAGFAPCLCQPTNNTGATHHTGRYLPLQMAYLKKTKMCPWLKPGTPGPRRASGLALLCRMPHDRGSTATGATPHQSRRHSQASDRPAIPDGPLPTRSSRGGPIPH